MAVVQNRLAWGSYFPEVGDGLGDGGGAGLRMGERQQPVSGIDAIDTVGFCGAVTELCIGLLTG